MDLATKQNITGCLIFAVPTLLVIIRQFLFSPRVVWSGEEGGPLENYYLQKARWFLGGSITLVKELSPKYPGVMFCLIKDTDNDGLPDQKEIVVIGRLSPRRLPLDGPDLEAFALGMEQLKLSKS